MVTKIKYKALPAYIILLWGMSSGCILENPSNNNNALQIGDTIPHFSVKMNDGNTITSTYLSKGTACIMFFHTTCPDCQKALQEMEQVYSRHITQGVKFALISREESNGSIAAYWEENSLTMPYSPQDNRDIYSLFAQNTIPRIYICKNGIITTIFTDSPTPTSTEIEEAISAQ